MDYIRDRFLSRPLVQPDAVSAAAAGPPFSRGGGRTAAAQVVVGGRRGDSAPCGAPANSVVVQPPLRCGTRGVAGSRGRR
jgi:hypothetical protein